MYYTSVTHGAIYKADMDGLRKRKIVTGLTDPYGIAVDLQNRRLYWADENNQKIQSSDLDGNNVQVAMELSYGENPFGVAVTPDRIYFSAWGTRTIHSMNKHWSDVQTHYTGSSEEHIAHIAIVENLSNSPSSKRANHCAEQECPNVCVLTAKSFRCLD